MVNLNEHASLPGALSLIRQKAIEHGLSQEEWAWLDTLDNEISTEMSVLADLIGAFVPIAAEGETIRTEAVAAFDISSKYLNLINSVYNLRLMARRKLEEANPAPAPKRQSKEG